MANRFHVVRLVNQHFLRIWKEHDPLGRVSRGLISLMRRHDWNLKLVQQHRLAQYLRFSKSNGITEGFQALHH